MSYYANCSHKLDIGDNLWYGTPSRPNSAGFEVAQYPILYRIGQENNINEIDKYDMGTYTLTSHSLTDMRNYVLELAPIYFYRFEVFNLSSDIWDSPHV